MLRFAYVTDSHIGGDANGWHMQPRYVGREVALFDALARWVKRMDVAFVVHGGDLTDHGLGGEIDRAARLCAALGVPVHLCLGNHDLAQADSLALWCAAGGALLGAGGDCHAIDAEGARIVIAHHHWHAGEDHRWRVDGAQEPRLDARQESALVKLIGGSDRPVIAVTHAPLNEVPASQRGTAEPFHPPHGPYAAAWGRIAATCPRLRLALCGHNHVTSRGDHATFTSCTTAAFSEPPAQAKLVTVGRGLIEVSTHVLGESLVEPAAVDASRAWVAGTAESQVFTLPST